MSLTTKRGVIRGSKGSKSRCDLLYRGSRTKVGAKRGKEKLRQDI